MEFSLWAGVSERSTLDGALAVHIRNFLLVIGYRTLSDNDDWCIRFFMPQKSEQICCYEVAI